MVLQFSREIMVNRELITRRMRNDLAWMYKNREILGVHVGEAARPRGMSRVVTESKVRNQVDLGCDGEALVIPMCKKPLVITGVDLAPVDLVEQVEPLLLSGGPVKKAVSLS